MKVCGSCKLNKCESGFRQMKGKTKTQSSYLCSLCKHCERQKALDRYRRNKNACNEYSKQYKMDNKEKINKTRREYTSVIMKDPIQRLKRNMKSLICLKIKKTRHTGEYLGAPIQTIVSWLEFNMSDEIKWDNYGKVWQIDHTIPINLWNIENEGEMLLCFSWMNLMPMIKEMNNKKSNKLLLWRVWHQERMLRTFSIHNPSLKDSINTFIQNYTCKVKYLYTQHA